MALIVVVSKIPEEVDQQKDVCSDYPYMQAHANPRDMDRTESFALHTSLAHPTIEGFYRSHRC